MNTEKKNRILLEYGLTAKLERYHKNQISEKDPFSEILIFNFLD